MAGDGFDRNVYWKLLEQSGEEKDQSVMVVDGVAFRAHTTTELKPNTPFNNRPKKRNSAEFFDCDPFAAKHLLLLQNQRGIEEK